MTSRYDSEGQPELEGNYFSEVGMKWEDFFLFSLPFQLQKPMYSRDAKPFLLSFLCVPVMLCKNFFKTVLFLTLSWQNLQCFQLEVCLHHWYLFSPGPAKRNPQYVINGTGPIDNMLWFSTITEGKKNSSCSRLKCFKIGALVFSQKPVWEMSKPLRVPGYLDWA